MAEWMDPVGQRRRQGMGLPHCCFAGRLEDACPRRKPSASALLTRQCRVTFPRGVWIPTRLTLRLEGPLIKGVDIARVDTAGTRAKTSGL